MGVGIIIIIDKYVSIHCFTLLAQGEKRFVQGLE